MNRKKQVRTSWTSMETIDFLAAMNHSNAMSGLDNKRQRNAEIFRLVLETMKEKGHNKTLDQIKNKWKVLKQEYYKARKANRVSGINRTSCLFFNELDGILGMQPMAISLDEGVETNAMENEPTVTDVAKKLTDIRTYNREIAKVHKVASETADQVYNPKWAFLRSMDKIIQGQNQTTRKACEEKAEDVAFEDADFDDINPPESPQPGSSAPFVASATPATSKHKNKRQKRSHTDDYNFFSEIMAPLKKAADFSQNQPKLAEDELDVFGRHVVNEIRTIQDSSKRDYVKYKILNLVYECKLEYTNSVKT